MTKEQYLQELRKFLQRLPESEQEEILADYDEHFRMGQAEGRSDAETAAALGSPMEIARNYYTQRAAAVSTPPVESEAAADDVNVLRSLIVLLALAAFNLILVLPLWLAGAGLVLGLLGAGIGLTFGGGAAITTSLAALIQGMAAASALSGVASGVGLAALGLIVLLLTFIVGRWFIQFTVRYLRWNADAIRR